MFFLFVTKQACDGWTERQTDGLMDGRTSRITIPKTALAYLLRAVELETTTQKHKVVQLFCKIILCVRNYFSSLPAKTFYVFSF